MSNRFLFICLFLCFSTIVYSQNWQAVGSGFNYPVAKLSVEPSENNFYAFGDFTIAGGVPAHYAAYYNDNLQNWDSIPFLHQYYTGQRILKYGSKLIFGSGPLLSWDGNTVDTFARMNGSIIGLALYNGSLVTYGGFDTIEGVPAQWIAKWDGNNWSAFDTLQWTGVGMVDAIEYKGELYIAGGMFRTGIRKLAKWNGVEWSQVGNGIQGGFSSVGSFAIYDNDLYIGGAFKANQGNPGNAIARWDGTQWKNVGLGMTSLNALIHDLEVYNGCLYACGQFNTVGNLPIKGIAKWDGTEWCGLGQETSPSYVINCMAVYNNELYIGGVFQTIDGDTVNYVAKWTGGNFVDVCGAASGIEESGSRFAFTLSPNPTNDLLTIETGTSKDLSANIYSVDGRLLKSNIALPQKTQLDVSSLPPGVYFLVVTDNEQRSVKRFVKQ